MVAPITGPFTMTEYLKGPPTSLGYKPTWVYRTRSWYRQKKPYTLPLSYDFRDERILDAWGGHETSYIDLTGLVFCPDVDNHPYRQRLLNSARAEFGSQMSSVRATLGNTIGEGKQSSKMIADRATQLYRGFRAARSGDLGALKRLWGADAGIRNRSKALGNHVLQYSFGWAPLVSDINNALGVFHNRMPPLKVRVRKRVSGKGDDQSADWGALTRYPSSSFNFGVVMGASVNLDNPNTYLANQLGLTNLASVAWELMPNSYVIDYFVNVGSFIDSFTDMSGLTISGAYTTVFGKAEVTVTSRWDGPPESWPDWSPISWSGFRVHVTRTPTISGPTLDFKLPWNLSWQRASTSIARLLQQLK